MTKGPSLTGPTDGRKAELLGEEYSDRIIRFWSAVQKEYPSDAMSILHQAVSAMQRPLIARLPYAEGLFTAQTTAITDKEQLKKLAGRIDQCFRETAEGEGQLMRIGCDDTAMPRGAYPYGVVCCGLVQGGAPSGWLAICGDRPFGQLDDICLLNLRGILSFSLPLDNYLELNRREPNAYLFRAMLEGKSDELDLSPVKRFIDELPKGDSWVNYVMVIDCSQDPPPRVQLLRDACSTMVTCSLRIIYEKHVVCLYHGRKKYPLEEHHNFTEYLRSNGWICALSKSFSGLEDVARYYGQAMAALSLGPKIRPGNTLYLYEDYVAFHVIQLAAQQLGMDELQSTHLLDLRNYDSAKGTELIQTLKAYLANLNDLASAAAFLSIHRNTLFYRLKKIEEITGWDLSDSAALHDVFFFMRVLDMMDMV